MLSAEVGLRRGELDLRLALEVEEGEVVALLGPNGAGKSSALRALAGLAALETGRIELDGRVLDDPQAGTFVPPAERSIGMVFQDALLFPRMTVEQNVAFGLRAQGRSREVARAVARAWLEVVGLGGLGAARPHELSGGQAQRVALARAMAAEPRVLLLDEPLSALDAQARPALRTVLREQLAEFGGLRLLVTHDPIDAVLLADRVVIVEAGHVVQAGSTAEVVARPQTPFVADLMGINLLRGVPVGPYRVQLPSGAELAVADALDPAAPSVAVAVSPRAVALHAEQPSGSPRNVWRAPIAEVQPDRDRVRITLAGPVPLTAEVTAAAVAELGLRRGVEVWASVKAVELTAYPLGPRPVPSGE